MQEATKLHSYDLLGPGDAATAIGVSVRTLLRYEEAGRILARRTPGGHRRYRRADVEALLTERAEAVSA